jgi:hypothetical protein
MDVAKLTKYIPVELLLTLETFPLANMVGGVVVPLKTTQALHA